LQDERKKNMQDGRKKGRNEQACMHEVRQEAGEGGKGMRKSERR
jgi:hypothetical protein